MTRWERTKLKGKIHIKHGFPFKSEHFRDSGNLLVLTPGNFYEEGGFKQNAENAKYYDGGFPSEYLLQEGDLIVAMTEQTDGLLGSMAFVPESGRFLHNQRLGLVTTVSDDVHLDFLYHLFKTSWIRKQIRLTSTGSKVKHTSPEKLYDLDVELPDRSTQEKIADVLSTIDSTIANNRLISEELEGIARLLYDYWFVQFDFPIDRMQALALGSPALEGRPYRTSGGKMAYSDVLKREIPIGWDVGNLERLGQVIGGSTPSTEEPEYFSKSGTPWITPRDLSENDGNRFIDHGAIDVSSEGIKAASLKLLPAGTVLMSSRAPVGYLAIARKPVTTNQGFKSVIPSTRFSTDFVYFTLKHFMKLIKANASGSTFKEISGSTLKAVKIPLPNSELVSKFSEFTSRLSAEQSNLEQQNQDLIKLRKWLLPLLMNGQVSVADNSPALQTQTL